MEANQSCFLNPDNPDDVLVLYGPIDGDGKVKKKKETPKKEEEKVADCLVISPTPLIDQCYLLPIGNAESLLFYESLIISNDKRETPILFCNFDQLQEIGSCCFMVSELDDSFLVFTTMQFTSNHRQTTQEVLSVVGKDLKLLHEKRIERICTKTELTEKSIEIVVDGDNFKLTKCTIDKVGRKRWNCAMKWNQEGDFLSVGAYVLMKRFLVLQKFQGVLQSHGCDINGNFFLHQQAFHPSDIMMLRDKQRRIQRIDELLIYSDGKQHSSTSFYLASSGQLLHQTWCDEPFTLHFNPVAELPLQTFTKTLSSSWQSDIKLLSSYLDSKETENAHAEAEMRDVIRRLAKQKPIVMDFTLDFIQQLERNGNDRAPSAESPN